MPATIHPPTAYLARAIARKDRPGRYAPSPLDPLIHEPMRLVIVSLLFRSQNHEATGFDLARAGVTPGGRQSHLAVLAANGYVENRRELMERPAGHGTGKANAYRSRLTEKGQEAFRAYCRAWRKLTG